MTGTKDWPKLLDAVEYKIEQQAEFVRWWRETVRGDGRPKTGADRGQFSREAAEEHTAKQTQLYAPSVGGRPPHETQGGAPLSFRQKAAAEAGLSPRHHPPAGQQVGHNGGDGGGATGAGRRGDVWGIFPTQDDCVELAGRQDWFA